MLLLTGCRSSDAAQEERIPGEPDTWQTLRIRQHLSYLNSTDLRGRSAASAGASSAARYLADRLGESGYQPVLAGEYRTTQSIRLSTLDGSAVSVTGRDTIRFSPGVDYLVDARSGAASVRIPPGLRVGSSGVFGEIAVAPTSDALTPGDIGDARLVVLTESVRLGSAPALRSGVPVIYPLSPFRERLDWPSRPERVRTGRVAAGRVMPDVRVDVRKTVHPSAPVVQVAGMLAGRGLAARDSLVVVMAPYDGFGVHGDRSWTNGQDLGIAAAALLEVAVRSGVVQRDWRIFSRSVMVVFVSGTRAGAGGAAAWMDAVPWDTNYISHVILVSDSPDEGLRSVIGHRRMPARVVSLAPAMSDTSEIARRLDASEFGVMPRDDLLRGDGLEDASEMTLKLAQEIYRHLLLASAVRRNVP